MSSGPERVHEVSKDGSFDIASEAPAKKKSAAAHTYDQGYTRWESFDPETAEVRETYSSVEKEVDFSLPLFATLPVEQREGVKRLLGLSDRQIDSLPSDQAETVRAYRDAYHQQLEQKRRPPPTGVERPPRLEPHEMLRAEVEKMTKWCSFDEASKRWQRVEAVDEGEQLQRLRAAEARCEEAVEKALAETVDAHKAEAKAAARKLRRSQRTHHAKARHTRATDAQDQRRAILNLAAAGLALDVC